MKLLADLHIAPRTAAFLRSLGHDVVRVSEILPPSASDQEIVAAAIRAGRTIITQDLDFTDLVALSGQSMPSVITLRLASSRVEYVNGVLERLLPDLEEDARRGALISVQETTVRRRALPLTPA
jgi:predicted nuclease of predicted toxin-antitoxin system